MISTLETFETCESCWIWVINIIFVFAVNKLVDQFISQWRKCWIVNRWSTLSDWRLEVRGNVKYLFSWTSVPLLTVAGQTSVKSLSILTRYLSDQHWANHLNINYISSERRSHPLILHWQTLLLSQTRASVILWCLFLLLFSTKKIGSPLAVLW